MLSNHPNVLGGGAPSTGGGSVAGVSSINAGPGISVDQTTGDVTVTNSGAGSGDVVGPGSATDNAVVRFDTTTGKLVQNSVATVSDVGALSTASATLTATTSLLLGTAGSAVGNIGFRNATSGTATLAPPTGALSTYTVTLPNVASTLPVFGQQITFAGPSTARTVTFPDANFTAARTDAANTFTGHQTIEGVTSTGATGTGKFVFDGTPTLVTPVIGAATGTSLVLTGTLTTGSGSGVAGGAVFSQGTTNSTGTTNITLQAPAAVTSYIRTLPADVGSTGFLLETVSGSVQTETLVAGTGSANVMRSTNPTLDAGSLTLAENASIALDPAGSADGKYSGITFTGTSGYSMAFGDVVMLDPNQSPGRWELASVSAAVGAVGDCRGNLAIVVVTATDGNTATLLSYGIIRADANFPTLTVNGAVYATTTGDITSTQPTTTDHVIRILGAALTADEIRFTPDNTWTTHT